MSLANETTVPDYIAGAWTIDPVHSEVGFSVRHMMVSKVRRHAERLDRISPGVIDAI